MALFVMLVTKFVLLDTNCHPFLINKNNNIQIKNNSENNFE